MSLVRPSKILNKAKKENKGVGAFNVLNLEMARAVIETAEETKVPVIVQVTSGAMAWAKFDYFVPMLVNAARKAKIDIALHLDHTTDMKLIKDSIKSGFTSVMFDGSHYDYNKNVKLSKKVVELAKKNNVDVEIEIGKVGGKEDDLVSDKNEKISDELASKFYEETRPTFLAVAFGTAHGVYKGEINLDYDLVKKCSKEIPVPLVMHGSSGVPLKDIRKAINSGITKVNIGTDLLIANFDAVRKYLNEHKKEYNIRKINEAGILAMKSRVKEYIKVLNKTK